MYETGQAIQGNTYQGIQSAVNAASPPQPSVGQALLGKIDQIHSALSEIRNRQKHLLARLHGERPEKDGEPKCGIAGSGLLGELDARISYLAGLTREISENQSTLDRLA